MFGNRSTRSSTSGSGKLSGQKKLALLDLGISSAAQGLGAVAAFSDSKARKEAALLKARQAAKKGEDELRIAGVKTGRLFGAQRAAFAANGLDIAGSVTVRDVLADTSQEGVREAKMIRDNAATAADSFRRAADSESPVLAATGVALGGFSQVASKWYAYKTEGVFG